MKPFWQDDFTTVYQGEALDVLRALPDHHFDAVVTDPPYSSGGLMRSDRAIAPSAKYVLSGTQVQRPEFFGDNRDQRSFLLWATMWMTECFRVVKPGGVLLCFTDWRQIPVMSDAIQCGGWVWRGVVPWDKTEASRPQKGWFRAQCEYILTASRGSLGMEQDRDGPCHPGLFRHSVRAADKHHITGKPTPLMQNLLGVVPAGGIVLDPFAGSGTTLVAAKNLGMKAVGVEMSREICETIKARLSQDVLNLGWLTA